MGASKPILLHVAARLEQQAQRIQHHAGNVSPRTKIMLRVARHVGRVEQRDGQRYGPHPKHLKDPEAEKRKEAVALVVEAVVFTRAQDAEEEEAREAHGPDDEEERGDELACVVVAAEGQGEHGEDGKVGAACEVWWRNVSSVVFFG